MVTKESRNQPEVKSLVLAVDNVFKEPWLEDDGYLRAIVGFTNGQSRMIGEQDVLLEEVPEELKKIFFQEGLLWSWRLEQGLLPLDAPPPYFQELALRCLKRRYDFQQISKGTKLEFTAETARGLKIRILKEELPKGSK